MAHRSRKAHVCLGLLAIGAVVAFLAGSLLRDIPRNRRSKPRNVGLGTQQDLSVYTDRNKTTIMEYPYGGCYGGFTHNRLIEEHPLAGTDASYADDSLIRLNVSMWQPYKMLMVETTIRD